MEESKFRIRGIPSELVDRFWKYAEPYVKRALDHTSGEFTPTDIRDYCRNQVIQLWLIAEGERVIGACTTEIVVYPQRKHCRVVTLGGTKAPEWTSLLDTILAAWAKEQGCVAMEAFVRKGYVPVLGKYGYKPKYTALVREIE